MQVSHWLVRRAVRTATRQMFARVTRNVIEEALPQVKATLFEEFGMVVEDRILGCGAHGCVLPIKGTQFVVKITDDRSEYDASTVSRRIKHPALPQVKAALQVGPHMYAIVRENLMPLSGGDESRVTDYGSEYLDALMRNQTPPTPTERGLPELEPVVDAIKSLDAAGCFVFDLHGPNVLRRPNGAWVFADLGASDCG